MNKLAMFWAVAMSRIRAQPIKEARPNSNRVPKLRRRGYYVNGQRVYYRPAARWLPNVKGMRYVRDESKGGIVSKLVSR